MLQNFKNKFSMVNIKRLIYERSFFELPSSIHPREHSKLIDEILGFNIYEIEKGLLQEYKAYNDYSSVDENKNYYPGTQAWIGLHPEILQTPYSELLDFLEIILSHCPNVSKFVDIGAGYGRLGIIVNLLKKSGEFIGYEIVPARANEGNRVFDYLDISDSCHIYSSNVLDDTFIIPESDVYFVYDFSDPTDIRTLLDKLSKMMDNSKFFVVARGKGIRSIIQNKYPEFFSAYGAIHGDNWSLYSSFYDFD